MKTIKSFSYKEGELWYFSFLDGTSASFDRFPLDCEVVGVHQWYNHVSGLLMVYSFWDFEKYALCPIKIQGLWGFVNNRLEIQIECKFDNVGVEFFYPIAKIFMNTIGIHRSLTMLM